MYAGFGCLFLLFFLFLALVLGALKTIFHVLFGIGRAVRGVGGERQNSGRRERETVSPGNGTRSAQQNEGKIFKKGEGQYVDFEEV